jgi:hypothetical protein
MHLDDHGLDDLARPLVGDGVQMVSLKQLFEPLPCEGLFADSAHLKPEGHVLIAAAIVKKIFEAKLISPHDRADNVGNH